MVDRFDLTALFLLHSRLKLSTSDGSFGPKIGEKYTGIINEDMYAFCVRQTNELISETCILLFSFFQGADPDTRPFDMVPFFEKNIFSRRAPIRRILGFWGSKVPQNGRFHAQDAHKPSCKI